MKLEKILVVMLIGIFLMPACIPGEQGLATVPMVASPVATSTEIAATVTATTPPTLTAEPSPTHTVVSDTPTPVSSPTSPPPTSSIPADWQIYNNRQHGFELSYPPGSALVEDEPDHARIDLPFRANTTLQEKYLMIDVNPLQADGTCSSPFASGYAPEAVQREEVSINDHNFLRESGSEGAAGSTYEWVAYSSVRAQECASLTFILHSTNAANYDVPPPEFDSLAEKEVFEQIVSTFHWLE